MIFCRGGRSDKKDWRILGSTTRRRGAGGGGDHQFFWGTEILNPNPFSVFRALGAGPGGGGACRLRADAACSCCVASCFSSSPADAFPGLGFRA